MLTLWWGFPTLIMRANLSDIGPILRGEIPEEALSIVLIRPMSDLLFGKIPGEVLNIALIRPISD